MNTFYLKIPSNQQMSHISAFGPHIEYIEYIIRSGYIRVVTGTSLKQHFIYLISDIITYLTQGNFIIFNSLLFERCIYFYVSLNWINIGSYNGRSPFRCQPSTWTSIVFISCTLGITLVKLKSKYKYHHTGEMLSAKCRPFSSMCKYMQNRL